MKRNVLSIFIIMKKKIIYGIMLSCILMTACNSDKEEPQTYLGGIVPVQYHIYFSDSQGNDLLDTLQTDMWKSISVTYEEKEYPALTESEAYENVFLKNPTSAMFMGLYIKRSFIPGTLENGDFELLFGYFDGEIETDLSTITLSMPDGQQVQLGYSNDVTMDHYQVLNIRQFFLNGQKLTDEWGKKGIYHFEYTPGEPLKYITDQGTVL